MAGQINAAAQIALAYPTTYQSIVNALGQNALPIDLTTVTAGQQAASSPQAYTEARNRVSNMIQRNLDALQIRINGYWTRGLQIAAVVVSIALILIFAAPSAATGDDYFKVVVFAIFGGMVAPVAKDTLGSLKTVKDRSR